MIGVEFVAICARNSVERATDSTLYGRYDMLMEHDHMRTHALID